MEQPGFWRVAFASIGDAVILTDEAGLVTYMNPVAEQLCARSMAEAVGKPLREVFDIVNEQTRQPVENPVERVLREGVVVGLANHTILLRPGRNDVPIDDSAAPIKDEQGRIIGVVLVFRDVREKREADLLRERLAAIVESSDDIIVSKDFDGIITSWNKGAQQTLGYRPEEVIGKHVSVLFPPDAMEDTEKILGKIRRGEKVDHYQTRRLRKDGQIIDVSLTVSPIHDSTGKIVGASKIGRDITQQKKLEAERQEADRRKDEFLAMLAHELRNPLASINNAVQLFGHFETEADLEWAKEVVQKQVKHLTRLIDDLLDASRITRGKISLRKELLDLSPIVSSAVEVVRPLIEDRQHELVLSLAPGALRLEADPVRLEQILINLLTNAAKYTDAGGRISLSAMRDDGHIVIRVQDNGIGIAPELMPHIFDAFTQGDRSIARSEGGLGIGLTLVQKLTEIHGGTVSVTSRGIGQGSEFTIRFPACNEAVSAKPHVKKGLPRVARQSSRILVVDDSVDTAQGMSKLLSLLGHDVKTAHDGYQALEVARQQRPEVILLDIGLPKMDGYQVVRQLRQESCCKTALIIAISGYGQDEDRRKSEEAGFDHHLVKPIDFDALLSLLA
jgi:PAS domain S-box-containing protein